MACYWSQGDSRPLYKEGYIIQPTDGTKPSKKLGAASSALCAVFCLVVSVCLAGGQTPAPPPSQFQQLARAIFQELEEIKSTESGVGSTPAAEAISRRLLAAGFPTADVLVIGPTERKKNLVARLHGNGKDKPLRTA